MPQLQLGSTDLTETKINTTPQTQCENEIDRDLSAYPHEHFARNDSIIVPA